MSDYISREDVLKPEFELLPDVSGLKNHAYEAFLVDQTIQLFKNYIKNLPAADVVEKSLYNTAMGNVYRFSAMLKVCRNELCLRCGNYKEAHKGACDGCRWKDGVWNEQESEENAVR